MSYPPFNNFDAVFRSQNRAKYSQSLNKKTDYNKIIRSKKISASADFGKMEIESENILNILLSPETYLDNPESIDYVSKVSKFSLEKLATEPEDLSEGKKKLLQQMQDLAFSNYKTFIQRADCLNEIHEKFRSVQGNLNEVSAELPLFSQRCQELRSISCQVDHHKKLNFLVTSKSSELLKVLELPQFMENCIKNGHFEEALELSSYIKWLGKKHDNIKLVKDIVDNSEELWQVMLKQLIAQLRTDLQLPKCLEIAGFIRRMEVYSDAELRLKFLQARDTWFRNLITSIPCTKDNQYFLKIIELTRIHLFNIMTQYRAIFSDEEFVITPSDATTLNKTYIFYSWLNEKIAEFLSVLDDQEIVKNISSLDSIVGQSMYFAHSFSRVGVDFRGLLSVKFIKIVEQNFEHSIAKINKKFKQDMERFSVSKISPLGKIKANVEMKPEQPPIALIEFYPLVDYLNGVLTAFNEMRSCAFLATADFITNLLQDSLKFCSKVIFSYYKVEQQTFEKTEREKFTRFCGGFQILVGYLQKCLHLIFPLQETANHLGIPIHQLQKERVTFLNESAILEPIIHLMPVDVTADSSIESA